MDIEDAVGDALIGLVTAVDKYDPDTAGAFASYASLWILQNISREQSTQRPFIYYPAHKKEDYFTLYPLIKRHGCIGCEQINKCPIAISIVKKRIECSEEGASKVLEQMMQDTSLDMLIDQFNECAIDHEYADIDIGDIICYISYETAISAEEALSSVNAKLLHEEISNITDNLTPKEARVIRLRYGLDGHAAYLKLLICGLFFPLTVFKQIKEDASVTDLYSILCESIRRPIAKPNRSNSRSYVSIIRADDPLQKNEYWCLLTLCRNVVWDEAMQAAACYATEHTAARKND